MSSYKQLDSLGAAYDALGSMRIKRAKDLATRKRRCDEVNLEFEKRIRSAKEAAPLPTVLWVAHEVIKELSAMQDSIRRQFPDFEDRCLKGYNRLCGQVSNDQSIEEQVKDIQTLAKETTVKELAGLMDGIVSALRPPFTLRSLTTALLSIRSTWRELYRYTIEVGQEIDSLRFLRGAANKLMLRFDYGACFGLMYVLDNLSKVIVDELQQIAAKQKVEYREGTPKALSFYEGRVAEARAWRTQQLKTTNRVQSEKEYSDDVKRLLWKHLEPAVRGSAHDLKLTRNCFELSRAERFERMGKERIVLVGWQQATFSSVAAQCGLGVSFVRELHALGPRLGLADGCIEIPYVLRLDGLGLVRVVCDRIQQRLRANRAGTLDLCHKMTIALLASYFEDATVRVSVASLIPNGAKRGKEPQNSLASMVIHTLEEYGERAGTGYKVVPLFGARDLRTFARDADIRLVLTCDHDSTRAALKVARAMGRDRGAYCHIIDLALDDERCGQLGAYVECDWVDYVVGTKDANMLSGITWRYDTMNYDQAQRTLSLYFGYQRVCAANSFLQDRDMDGDGIPDGLGIGMATLAIDTSVPEGERLLYANLHRGMDALLHGRETTPNSEVLYVAHSLIWQFVALSKRVPVEIFACDMEGHGNNMAPFIGMSRAMQTVFQEFITNGDDMAQTLRMLNSRVDKTIRDRFDQGRTESLVSYNRANPHDVCPLTLFVVFGFPERLGATLLRSLLALVESGGPWGISVLLVGSTRFKFGPYDESQDLYDQIVQKCTDISVCENDGSHSFRWDNECRLRCMPLPVATELDAFAQSYLHVEERRKSESVSFGELIKRAGSSGDSDSSEGICVPVGIGRNSEVVSIKLGVGTLQHALVIGGTGSGKSTLFHTFILSAMHAYAPDQLTFFLMDFKGPEFKVYESHPTPHVRCIAIDAAQVFGEGILEMLTEEMERRNRLFKDVGVSNITDYVARSGASMPRIIVIMDEFQVLYGDGGDNTVAKHCADLTDDLAKKGRSTGVNLIMATQSLVNAGSMYLEQSTLEQMTVRVGLKCRENDIRRLFGDDLVASVQRIMDGPIGTAVLSNGGGSNVEGFRVAYCSSDERPQLLEGIRLRYANEPMRPKVFEGGRTRPLSGVFCRPRANQVEIILGEQLKRGESLCRVLDKRRHNLLVCGDDKAMTRSFVYGVVLSALRYSTARVFLVDGRYLVDETDDELVEGIRAYAGDRFACAEGFDDLFSFVRDVDDAGRRAGRGDRSLLILKDVQYLDDALDMLLGKPVVEEFDDEPAFEAPKMASVDPNSLNPFAESFDILFGDGAPAAPATKERPRGGANPTDILQRLLARGYQRGTHVMVTCDSPQTLRGLKMSQAYDNLGERLVFGLSINDAYSFIEGLTVKTLEEGIGYYSDGRGLQVQLRPYGMPTGDEVGTLYESIREEDR